MKSPIEDIIEELSNPEAAKEYGQELAKINVAVTMAKARTEKGLTQEQLAARAGTSQPYIAKLESGYANPSVAAIGKILAVMGFRLVPDKESLIPEIKHFPQNVCVFISYASEGEAIIAAAAASGTVNAYTGANPEPEIIMWQNPNLPENRSFVLRTGSVQLANEAYGLGTANSKNPTLVGTNREA